MGRLRPKRCISPNKTRTYEKGETTNKLFTYNTKMEYR